MRRVCHTVIVNLRVILQIGNEYHYVPVTDCITREVAVQHGLRLYTLAVLDYNLVDTMHVAWGMWSRFVISISPMHSIERTVPPRPQQKVYERNRLNGMICSSSHHIM